MAGETLGAGLLKALPWVLKVLAIKPGNFGLRIRCSLPPQDERVRFVRSVLLCLSHNGEYFLINNSHRRETFAPLGGVVKYLPQTKSELNSLNFVAHVVDRKSADNDRDIRGFIPKRSLLPLKAIASNNTKSESFTECIKRELKEEIREISIKPPNYIDKLNFRVLKVIIEPLTRAELSGEKENLLTHREFVIVELIDDGNAEKLKRLLLKSVGKANSLLLCSDKEITQGRSKEGRIIAQTARYFFSDKPIHAPLSQVPFENIEADESPLGAIKTG